MKPNKWYFYNKKEVVELQECKHNSYWLEVVGKPGYGYVDSWEEQNNLYDTKKECLKAALKYAENKVADAEKLRDKLFHELIYEAGDEKNV